ncbi:MAG: hypothetical protein H3C58_06065 [Fimbriimonadaceae bacterium]|nr:hypothetical protein [Fimbriimonadaceae bacterium]
MRSILAVLVLAFGLLVVLAGCGEPPPKTLEITQADRDAMKNVKGGGRPAPMPVDGIDN